MICPLMSRPSEEQVKEGIGGDPIVEIHCQEENCAWFDTVEKSCAAISLLIQISGVK